LHRPHVAAQNARRELNRKIFLLHDDLPFSRRGFSSTPMERGRPARLHLRENAGKHDAARENAFELCLEKTFEALHTAAHLVQPRRFHSNRRKL
jgi:hypothetical protein